MVVVALGVCLAINIFGGLLAPKRFGASTLTSLANLFATGQLGVNTSTFSNTAGVVQGSASTTVFIGGPEDGARSASLCIWNGTSWTRLQYAAGATNTNNALSGTCSTN